MAEAADRDIGALWCLVALAEARALLFNTCEYEDLGEAITPLLVYAHVHRIEDEHGAEAVMAIVRTAFLEYVEPSAFEVVAEGPT